MCPAVLPLPRRAGEGPTGYPVACSPQAWAAASVFMVLQACLGLRIFGAERHVLFSYPLLPESLKMIQITGLRVGEASVDLYLERHGPDVGVNVLKREGDVEVVVVK